MSVLATDSFNRADTLTTQVEHLNDNGGGGVTWASMSGTLFWKIVSNTARPINTGGDIAERVTSITWPTAQYIKVVFGTVSTEASVGTGCGPCGYMIDATQKTYYLMACSTAGTELQKFSNSTFTSLKTVTTADGKFANGDTGELRITTSGGTNSFVMLKNSVEFGAGTTDSSSPLAAGLGGIGYSSTAAVAASIDSFEGGDVPTAAQILPAVMQEGQSWSVRYV